MGLKILNITEEGRGGGPLKRIKNVAHTLNEKGIETIVLFPSKNSDDFREALTELNVPYLETSMHRLTKEKTALFKYLLTFFPEIWKIKNIIKRENIDIMLCNGSWQVKGIIAAKWAGIKSIWIQNDSFQPKMVQRLFKFVSRYADSFIFGSNRTKDFYSKVNPDILKKPNSIIQSPIDLDKFKPEPQRDFFKNDAFNIVTVGYVNPNKGLETLIECASIVAQSQKKIQFQVCGVVFDSQKQYFEKLQNAMKKFEVDNLHFLGFVDDLFEVLHSADLYVCSSDFEASPIAVWEAMSCGLPVVTTDVGDVREIVDANKAGIVVPTKSPDQLAEAILSMCNDTSSRKQFGKTARKTAESYFSLQNIAEQYKQFYQSMAQS